MTKISIRGVGWSYWAGSPSSARWTTNVSDLSFAIINSFRLWQYQTKRVSMASSLFKALIGSSNCPLKARNLSSVSAVISNHTAKWMQVILSLPDNWVIVLMIFTSFFLEKKSDLTIDNIFMLIWGNCLRIRCFSTVFGNC